MNTNKKKDILEIFVKVKFGIRLTEEEKSTYLKLDDDVKKTINELIDSYSFMLDLQNILDKMYIEKDITTQDKCRIDDDLKLKRLEMKRVVASKKN